MEERRQFSRLLTIPVLYKQYHIAVTPHHYHAFLRSSPKKENENSHSDKSRKSVDTLDSDTEKIRAMWHEQNYFLAGILLANMPTQTWAAPGCLR